MAKGLQGWSGSQSKCISSFPDVRKHQQRSQQLTGPLLVATLPLALSTCRPSPQTPCKDPSHRFSRAFRTRNILPLSGKGEEPPTRRCRVSRWAPLDHGSQECLAKEGILSVSVDSCLSSLCPGATSPRVQSHGAKFQKVSAEACQLGTCQT